MQCIYERIDINAVDLTRNLQPVLIFLPNEINLLEFIRRLGGQTARAEHITQSVPDSSYGTKVPITQCFVETKPGGESPPKDF